MLRGRDYTLQAAALHQKVHKTRPTKIVMAQELRSSVAAQMSAGATKFELDPQYVEFGRVAFTFPESGARFQLKSRAALPFNFPLPLEGDLISVSPDIIFLLVFDFEHGDLVLDSVPARMLRTQRGRRFELLDGLTPLGRWSADEPRRETRRFDQGEAGNEERPWWDEDDGTDDEIRPAE